MRLNSGNKHSIIARLVISLTAILIYSNAFTAGYTFDDVPAIAENPLVHQRSLRKFFTEDFEPGPIYRPITTLTFAIDEATGLNPAIGHVHNALLHALVSLLVFSFSTRLVPSIFGQFTGAMIFALHPVHTEAVTNLVGRAELLAATLSLASLLAFARYQETGERKLAWLALALLLFSLGPFAKENAMTVLALIPLLQWQISDRSRTQKTALQKAIPTTAMFLVAALPYLTLRLQVFGALTTPNTVTMLDNPLGYLPTSQRIMTALAILGEYIGLLVLPLRLTADYSFDQVPAVSSLMDARLIAASFMIGLGMTASWRYRTTCLPFCVAFFFCTLSLTSNILFPIGTIKAERLLYLPSVGWCIGIGAATALTSHRRAIGTAVVILLFSAFALRTWVRNYDWKDNPTLFRSTVASSPNSAKAHYNYGVALHRNGDPDKAQIRYRRALEIYPDFDNAASAIGNIYEQKQLPNGAQHWYNAALKMDWRSMPAHKGLGRIRSELGELDSAEAIYRTGLELWPEDPTFMLALAEVLVARNNMFEAGLLVHRYDTLPWISPTDRDQLHYSRTQLASSLNERRS